MWCCQFKLRRYVDIFKNHNFSTLKFCLENLYVKISGDAPALACKLLAHKIQSPQEREALQALAVLEACVKSCGPSFHTEVGKFKFLNEMIKLVSPKYLVSIIPYNLKKNPQLSIFRIFIFFRHLELQNTLRKKLLNCCMFGVPKNWRRKLKSQKLMICLKNKELSLKIPNMLEMPYLLQLYHQENRHL